MFLEQELFLKKCLSFPFLNFSETIKILFFLQAVFASSSVINCSWNFSPNLGPIVFIFISFGLYPYSDANFSINTLKRLPTETEGILRIKISSPFALTAHFNTKSIVSAILIINLVIWGAVRVTGPPFFICLLNKGISDPLESKTLPNLTEEKIVFLFPLE